MQSNILPPRTIMEVYKSLPEGTLAELINGNLYMSPAPKVEHQRILLALARTLSAVAENQNAGEVFIAPCDVFFDEHSNAVQPDIFFVAEANKSIISENAIHGVPDLLIEILSPMNREHDLVRKKSLYQKFGVKEYWVVDPESKETIGFFLEGITYVALEAVVGRITSRLLQCDCLF